MSHEFFDYFAHVELPSPALDDAEVRRLFAEAFGVDVDLRSLGSQQDQNFRVFPRGSSEPLGVLKLSNPVFSEPEIDMQDAAAATVGDREPELRVPRVVIGPHGPLSSWWNTSQGRIHARVIENLSGRTLMGSRYLSPAVVRRMGELSARVSLALADFDHAASGRVLQWDLRHAGRVIDTLLPLEPDAAVREFVRAAADDALRTLRPVAESLPTQAGHFDITDDNVLHRDDDPLPDAVIDFGDVARSWRVGEIATTVSSLLHHDGATLATTLPAIWAFHERRPLDENELTALWPLVVLRGAVLALSGRQQVRLDDANSYAGDALEREMLILKVAASVPARVMNEVILDSLGHRGSLDETWTGAPLAVFDRVTALDAGTTSPLNDEGGWSKQGALDDAALASLDDGSDAVFLPAWQAVLTGAPTRTPEVPATIPTGLTLWLAQPTPIAGLDHTPIRPGMSAVSHGGETLTISGLPASWNGAVLPARTRLFVQRHRDTVAEAAERVTADMAAGWRSVLGDPAPAFGFAPTPAGGEDSDQVLGRREAVLAEVQEHYYARPPEIERGWREYLIDVDGRVYLDMVNNIASVGHAHPRIAEAAHRQLRLLNTNSRFHYRAITDYAQRIAATLPDELDTVFFVNSGSEAVDLAIRLAQASTGRPDMVAMREAYHGWTFASDAVSTSVADNPSAVDSRPEWVHTVAAANPYRGTHRGADAVKYAPDAAQVIDALADAGTPPAGFICESYFGNAGGVALPDGYLREVYAAVRRHGGIAIADEVQVGFGRLGEWFWGFQQQDAVPDIVAVAKSIGAGQPLGAVITRREIADRYRTQGYFFSSTGGSPLSSVVGLTVLDIIRDEGLQENARQVGAHLRSRLEALAEDHPIIGAVHGSGLYLGLEFVLDRETLEPATRDTAAICDRLRERGVIMQPTGDHLNVFKIKPPLCVTRASVDYFADAVAHVLATGW
ncbi:aminotransferase [Microbacterium sp. W4I20]|uniref:aminotransferase n=1 Tax=Microbacterium sp. W4I20 TaxID=3042262 RepID=UPI00278B0FCC|nr:aminotransferase [Microbacterium sp. W4I20]MDQ0728816.1 4-aminobutyrate aminotransferase-like enzyme/Ser/Thr protein kinase RdoA (MazF antagonist) [Microbacterium sp. W4I20]